MKNTFSKTIGMVALAVVISAMFAQIQVSAQDPTNDEKTEEKILENLFVHGGNARALEGTWNLQVTLRNCQNSVAIRSISEIATFMFGGTMLQSTSGIPQALKTPGHGVWIHTRGREFKFSFKSFSFDAGGNFTGWMIVRQFVLVNSRATGYESFGNAEFYAANGNLVFTGCSTTTATRFE